VKPPTVPAKAAPQEVKPPAAPAKTESEGVKPPLAPQEVKPPTAPAKAAPEDVKLIPPPVKAVPQEVKPPTAQAETSLKPAKAESEGAKPPTAPAEDTGALRPPDGTERVLTKPPEQTAVDDGNRNLPVAAAKQFIEEEEEEESAPDFEVPADDRPPKPATAPQVLSSHTEEEPRQSAELEPVPEQGESVADLDDEEEEHEEGFPHGAYVCEIRRGPPKPDELRKVHERFLATSGQDVATVRGSARVEAEQAYKAVISTFAARAEARQYAPRNLLMRNAEMIEKMEIKKHTPDEIREMIDTVKGQIEQMDGEIEQLKLEIAEIKRVPAGEKV
jgi:hypothetical protein